MKELQLYVLLLGLWRCWVNLIPGNAQGILSHCAQDPGWWWYSKDHMRCWELNYSWPHASILTSTSPAPLAHFSKQK